MLRYNPNITQTQSQRTPHNNNNNNSTNPQQEWTLKCTDLPQYDALISAADEFYADDKLHLRNLCSDTARCAGLTATYNTTGNNATTMTTNNTTPTHTAHTNSTIPSSTTSYTMVLDYSRQRVTGETMELLFDLADAVGLTDRMQQMYNGIKINSSEDRPVIHHWLRIPMTLQATKDENSSPSRVNGTDDSYMMDGPTPRSSPTEGGGLSTKRPSPVTNASRTPSTSSTTPMTVNKEQILQQIQDMKQRIRDFSNRVRNGDYEPAVSTLLRNQQKDGPVKNIPKFQNILVVTSSLGTVDVECLSQALASDPQVVASIKDASSTSHKPLALRVLSNIDPVHFQLQTNGWQPEETLVIVMSSTFTETDCMLNARTVKQWLLDGIFDKYVPNEPTTTKDSTTPPLSLTEQDIMAKHMLAVSSNPTRVAHFGIPIKTNLFRLWDWTSPRFGIGSPFTLLPLSLQYGYSLMEDVMAGAHDMDEHFFHCPLRDNIPVILGLLGVWNSTFLGYSCRGILPYSQALKDFPRFVQHIDMESNGKRVALDGTPLLHRSAEITFGDVGNSCQSVFFQSLHQGRAVPLDFIGFMESPNDVDLDGEAVSNHDELMSHFFAQPDALAYGKTLVDLIQEGAPEPLREHMAFPGNRPSSSILLTRLDAFSIGQLLALYEHRTVVQGFIWGINSFDRFGLDLGKALVKTVRAQLSASRKTGASVQGFNYSTSTLLEQYLSHGKQNETYERRYGWG